MNMENIVKGAQTSIIVHYIQMYWCHIVTMHNIEADFRRDMKDMEYIFVQKAQ